MKILALNPGSETIKGAFFVDGKKLQQFESSNTENLLAEIKKDLGLKSFSEIDRIGVRIVHGGNKFTKPTLIGAKELKELKKLTELAPLHNKPALRLIEAIKKVSPKVKIYGIFDTAFHRSIPDFAATYAIPYALTKKYDIKRFGFHGIACENILRQIKARTKKLPKRMVICHLGGGASITAVKNGKSVDTSMGFTPLEGLMMVTRSGDIDAGLVAYLARKLGGVEKALEVLNHRSGIAGLTGKEDFAAVRKLARKGNRLCRLAVEIFVYRIVKYICSYYGVLGGLDALVFSGGIGFNSLEIRQKVLRKLKLLGKFKVYILQVDEAEEIARKIFS
jgi:acetate kinase